MNRPPPDKPGKGPSGLGPDDSGGFLSSNLARAGEHFAAKDTDPADATERWATRIGRGLSLIAFVGLAWYFGYQLKWW